MRAIALFISILCFSNSCCVKKDFKKNFNKYEVIANLLEKNKDKFIKYEKEFNISHNSNYIFLAGKKELEEIIKREGVEDLKAALNLWNDRLIHNGKASLRLLKNGDIYFQLSKCKYGSDYLVFDGGEEEMEIDVSDDNIKRRIKPKWIYIEMK